MPSPFPGMNPYLEHPDVWPEVHNRLIVEVANALVPQVRPKYRVAIEKRIYEINDNPNTNGSSSELLAGIPDVTVKRQQGDLNYQASAVAVASPTTQAMNVTVPLPEEIREAYLEVRELESGRVITVIEILSPANKRKGEGRETYIKKRQRVLGSLTHLVEIDLLRQWQPMPLLTPNIESDYRMLVSCHDTRPQAKLYAVNLRSPLPTFSLPLQPKDTEPTLDLQSLLHEVYHTAGFDYTTDYGRDPQPPLNQEDTAWAIAVLETQGLR